MAFRKAAEEETRIIDGSSDGAAVIIASLSSIVHSSRRISPHFSFL